MTPFDCRRLPVAVAAILLSLSFLSSFVHAETPSGTGEGTSATEPADKRDRVINELLRRVEELERVVDELRGYGAEAAPPGVVIPARDPEGIGKEHVEAGRPEDPPSEQDRLLRAAFERALIERGGLLLPPYTFEVEPAFSYVHSSADSIIIDGFSIQPVLVVGDIVSERIRRDSFTTSMSVRVGLPWDLQAGVYVPYRYESQMVITADNEEINKDVDGFGDVEVSLSGQLLRERGPVPALLAGVRWKTKTGEDPYRPGAEDELSTGTGFTSLDFTATAVKVSDPMVFFGGLSYTYNSPDTKSVGAVDPGDSYGVQLGMALAFNFSTSLNMSFEERYTERTRLNGVDVPGTYLNTGTFSLGVSYLMEGRTSLDISLGVGLTEDAPDIMFGLAVPVRVTR